MNQELPDVQALFSKEFLIFKILPICLGFNVF